MTAQPLRLYLHALAERLGYTVTDLARRVTLAEVRGWLAYDRYRREREEGKAPAAGPLTPAQLAAGLGVIPVRKADMTIARRNQPNAHLGEITA